jgi:uncharacterized RDD family membrane protein YckC
MKRFVWCITLLLGVAVGRCDRLGAQSRQAPSPPQEAVGAPERETSYGRDRWRDVLRVGQDYTLPAGEALREVAVVFGDATIDGEVYGDVVVVFGNARVNEAGTIGGTLVVIGGGATAAAGAALQSDVIIVGGSYTAPSGVTPGGQHLVIGPEMVGGNIEAIVPWLTRGLLWGRPIVPGLAWVWGVVAILFLVYLALNLVFDYPVRASAATLAGRPLTAFLVGLLVLLLAGPVCVLLAVSVIGIAVVPFVIGALLVAFVLGKVAVTRWIGMRMVPQEDVESRLQGTRSFVLGFAAICVAYMVPLLGFLTWTMLSVLGLGGASLAFMSGYRRENPAAPRATPAKQIEPVPAAAASQAVVYEPAVSAAGDPEMPSPTLAAAPPPSAPVSDLTVFPRARFLDRLAAFVLDVILVLVAYELLALRAGERAVLLMLLAYHIAFWTWKGTTVGGIICQLRVVRVDGARLRFVDSLVRGLSGIFSLAVLGLGALWILRDPERQAWHDKIAGTYVVRVPRHYPL